MGAALRGASSKGVVEMNKREFRSLRRRLMNGAYKTAKNLQRGNKAGWNWVDVIPGIRCARDLRLKDCKFAD